MTDNLYTAPEAELTSVIVDEPIIAARRQRLFAAIIDTLIMILLIIPIVFLIGIGDLVNPEQSIWDNFLYGLVGTFAYIIIQIYPLMHSAQTWGKKMMSIQITDMEGVQSNIPQLSTRYGFYFVLSLIPVIGGLLTIIDCCFIFGENKQCLHDIVAKTKVIAL